ncbi:MAG: DUF288 domain-containing protein [Acidobacteria bacterium]|nr:DUF288 domain-containing protein [Acidobacteriota bacterium]
MNNNRWIIITTINHPTEAILRIAELCPDWNILVVGDRKTPSQWHCDGARFLDIDQQASLPFSLAQHAPFNHYARKNLGYLLAIAEGAEVILETDDDNIPYDWYPGPIELDVSARGICKQGWENTYRHFSSQRIWPRGFPLEFVNESLRERSPLSPASLHACPIQQFLANENPDVDAVYRLTTEGEIVFEGDSVILGPGTWCPVNSQNTLWFPDAFDYLYLPATATFRMTDIWRSLVAQVCLQASGGHIAFHGANMFQRRNEHSLIRDFKDEISGYLHNVSIMEALTALSLREANPAERLSACYTAMVSGSYLRPEEETIVEAWNTDLAAARSTSSRKADSAFTR